MKNRTLLLGGAIALLLALGAVAILRGPGKSLLPTKFGRCGAIYAREAIDGRGEKARFLVYVPYGYEKSSERYPVLYLLHGLSDDETSWSNPKQGKMKAICDRYFAERPDRKMIVVMPDARATWYRNSYSTDDDYEDFFFNTLIPRVESEFRCKTNRKDRAVAGVSMGGYGAALYALHRPELFGAAFAMSPDLAFGRVENDRSPDDENEEERAFSSFSETNDVFRALEQRTPDELPRIMIDCGDDDGCLLASLEFFQKARNRNVPLELRVRNGSHNWEYWRVSLVMALDFIFDDLQ